MPEVSYFFDGVSGDRTYSSASFLDWINQLFGRKNGVIPNLDNQLALSAPGSYTASVNTGIGAFSGAIYKNTLALSLGLAVVPTTYKRIDLVVVRFDSVTNRSANATVITGTQTTGTPVSPASSPTTDLVLGQVLIDNTTGSPVYTVTDLRTMRPFFGDLPPGIMHPFAGALAPPGFLICDGSAISRTAYAGLFASIGTVFGSGDGSTTFNIPDARGATLRGAGTSTKFTQNVTITLGQIINDILQSHLHLEGRRVTQSMSALIYAYGVTGGASQLASSESASGTVNYQQGNTSTPMSDGTNGAPRTGNETSGKALGVNWIIQF